LREAISSFLLLMFRYWAELVIHQTGATIELLGATHYRPPGTSRARDEAVPC
jgi:hypothetical protein